MKVSAIIVTRGNVDLGPVLRSLPRHWEKIVWNNGAGTCSSQRFEHPVTDLSVFGRYAAIEHASHELIYVQDDDAIVSDLAGFHWAYSQEDEPRDDLLVANMPDRFRPHYPDSCLVGFGAMFHRDLPRIAFDRWWNHDGIEDGWFHRTCDVVFTTLTPRRLLVDIPHTDREFASDPDRMWRQAAHVGERTVMLDLARHARDSA